MRQKPVSAERRSLPPYGPTSGMIEALQLMQRMTPAMIDEDFLRANRIARGNEYKVMGALRFLNLIDGMGKPTEESRFLKTRGLAFTLGLQDIVRTAYNDLFTHLNPKEISRENIYNYFVTKEGMGTEMAIKASRFFVALCQLAEIELAPDTARTSPLGAKREAAPRTPQVRSRRQKVEVAPIQARPEVSTDSTFPLVLAITPETAKMETEQLTELFRKMKVALRRAFSEDL